MLIKEMHIELDLIVKRINSNAFKRILPQEKDWFLNRAIIQYFNDKKIIEQDNKRLGFQGSRKRYKDLETHLQRISLPLYYYDSTTQYAILPDDWFDTDFEEFNINWTCNTLALSSTNSNIYYCIVDFSNTAIPLTYHNAGLTVSFVDNVNTITTTLATVSGTIAEIDQKFEHINELIWKLQQTGFQVYWENFDGVNYPESLIIVSTTGSTANQIRITATAKSDINTLFTSKSVVTKTTTGNTNNITSVPGRLTTTFEVAELNNFPFGKTKYDSPLETFESGRLYVYNDGKFIANSLLLRYIRNPKPVNSILNWHCDLNASLHTEIVRRAATMITGANNMNSYQYLNKENSVTE